MNRTDLPDILKPHDCHDNPQLMLTSIFCDMGVCAVVVLDECLLNDAIYFNVQDLALWVRDIAPEMQLDSKLWTSHIITLETLMSIYKTMSSRVPAREGHYISVRNVKIELEESKESIHKIVDKMNLIRAFLWWLRNRQRKKSKC